MKFANSAARRRVLFMGGSSVSAILLALAAPAAVTLAPTAAHAAFECGPVTGDPIVCEAGDYISGITYPANSPTDVLPVVLQDGVTVLDDNSFPFETAINIGGGIFNPTIPDLASLDVETVTPDSGDIHVVSDFFGIMIGGDTVTVDLTDDDSGDESGTIVAGYNGLFASGGAGGASVNFDNVAITVTGVNAFGSPGPAIIAGATGGDVSIVGTGDLIGGGVSGTSQGGKVTINVGNVTSLFDNAITVYAVGPDQEGGADVTANGTVVGDIMAVVNNGPLIINALGAVDGDVTTLTGDAASTTFNAVNVSGFIDAEAQGSGSITINTGDVGGPIDADAQGGGSVSITAGAVGGPITASTVDGGGIGVSFASAGGDILAQAVGGGSTSVNGGNVAGSITASADTGGSVSIGVGSVSNFIFAGAVGGGSVDINAGDIGGSLQAVAVGGGGNVTVNVGRVFHVDALAMGGGAVNVVTNGVVGFDVEATAVGGGSADVVANGTVFMDVVATATGGGRASATAGDVGGSIIVSADAGGAVIVNSTLGVSGTVSGTALGGGAVGITNSGRITGGIVAEADMGGAVTVTSTGDVTGGIAATSSGGGAVTVAAANVTGTGTPIMATSDTGDVSVTVNGTVTGDSGFLAEISTAGSATIGIGAGVTATQADFDVTYGEALTINNGGTWTGAIDFSGGTSGHFNNASDWTAEDITFTDGDDSFVNSGTATFDGERTYDFMGGADSFTNSGDVLIGTALTLDNLETFANSGTVVIGTDEGASTLTLSDATAVTNTGTIVFGGVMEDGEWVSDGETNDRLVADGAAFTGGGTLLMDVDFGAGVQADCSEATAADCVSLVGGSTTGAATTIQLNAVGAGTSSLNRIVLVDVAGGTSSEGAFVLGEDQPLEQGLFFYRLDYDADEEQFVLAGQANRGIYEFAQIGASAQNVWYSSISSYFDRQADLRNQLEAANGPGAWLRVSHTNTDREIEAAGFNLGHEQNTDSLVGGIDLVRGAGDGMAYAFGVTAGHVDSEVEFDIPGGKTNLDGTSYGLYGSLLGPNYFVDAIVQANQLDVDQDGAWNPGGFAKGEVKSTGAQVEGGWRFGFMDDKAFVEPLASLAYVSTEIDELELPGTSGVIDLDDATSLRGSIGLRLSGDGDIGGGLVQASVTGRLWNEFEGENEGVLLSADSQQALMDDMSGSFSELGGGVAIYSANRMFSGFVNTTVKFGDDYLSTNASLGVRVQW